MLPFQVLSNPSEGAWGPKISGGAKYEMKFWSVTEGNMDGSMDIDDNLNSSDVSEPRLGSVLARAFV